MATIKCTNYLKDAAMWREVATTTFEADPKTAEEFAAVLGYKKTAYGSYWKQTAYDQAEEITIIQ